MAECCGTCSAYTASSGQDKMPGFGNCKDLPKWQYVSEWPFGCRFVPSRYDGPDPDPHQPNVAQPAARSNDPPPFELT